MPSRNQPHEHMIARSRHLQSALCLIGVTSVKQALVTEHPRPAEAAAFTFFQKAGYAGLKPHVMPVSLFLCHEHRSCVAETVSYVVGCKAMAEYCEGESLLAALDIRSKASNCILLRVGTWHWKLSRRLHQLELKV